MQGFGLRFGVSVQGFRDLGYRAQITMRSTGCIFAHDSETGSTVLR